MPVVITQGYILWTILWRKAVGGGGDRNSQYIPLSLPWFGFQRDAPRCSISGCAPVLHSRVETPGTQTGAEILEWVSERERKRTQLCSISGCAPVLHCRVETPETQTGADILVGVSESERERELHYVQFLVALQCSIAGWRHRKLKLEQRYWWVCVTERETDRQRPKYGIQEFAISQNNILSVPNFTAYLYLSRCGKEKDRI